MKDLTKGSITKLIFWFALPVFIGSLLQMTYNLVDTKIIGYVLGESSLAAVGSTNSVNTLVIGFLQGLTNGFAVIAAPLTPIGITLRKNRSPPMLSTTDIPKNISGVNESPIDLNRAAQTLYSISTVMPANIINI